MSKDKTPQQRLWEMIKDIRFAMLTHRHGDGACTRTRSPP